MSDSKVVKALVLASVARTSDALSSIASALPIARAQSEFIKAFDAYRIMQDATKVYVASAERSEALEYVLECRRKLAELEGE